MKPSLKTANLITWDCIALVNRSAIFWYDGTYLGVMSEPYTASLSQ